MVSHALEVKARWSEAEPGGRLHARPFPAGVATKLKGQGAVDA